MIVIDKGTYDDYFTLRLEEGVSLAQHLVNNPDPIFGVPHDIECYEPLSCAPKTCLGCIKSYRNRLIQRLEDESHPVQFRFFSLEDDGWEAIRVNCL
jgi:hypothetical protein